MTKAPDGVARADMLRSPRPIMDLANVVDPRSTSNLKDEISSIEQDTQTQVEIVIVIKYKRDFHPNKATTLFNQLALGPATKNNCVLILAVLDERRIEIKVGSDLNWDMGADWCISTLKETAVPYFRQELLVETMERVASRRREVDSGLVVVVKNDIGFEMIVGVTFGALFVAGMTKAWYDSTFPLAQEPCSYCQATNWTYETNNWETVVEATDQRAGRRRKIGVCGSCGQRNAAYQVIPKYGRRGYDSDGQVYYYKRRSSSSSDGVGGGSSDGGGGGSDR